MSALVRSIRRNVLAAIACAASSTTTSAAQKDWLGKGIRFYVTVASPTAGGGTDTIFLCAMPPAGGAAVPIAGFAAANALSVAGTYFADFYPGAWLPPTVAAGGKLLGAAGIAVPLNWAVQVLIGAGNAATITIDAETIP